MTSQTCARTKRRKSREGPSYSVVAAAAKLSPSAARGAWTPHGVAAVAAAASPSAAGAELPALLLRTTTVLLTGREPPPPLPADT